MIVGAQNNEDAGVFLLNPTTALIQTLDFFTPIVDDPYSFGQIAAANALSDVYAMGGKPLLCMNILACPVKEMADEVFRAVVEGGLSKVKEAGALLVGGHSVEDQELKYGLSVTGLVHPRDLLLNSGARPGDALVLTKPLGTGILSTAVKGGLGTALTEQTIVAAMAMLNRQPMECATAHADIRDVLHAATDITGFGLFGHLHEMAEGSGVSMRIRAVSLPILPDVIDFADMGIIPEGAYTNRNFYNQWVISSLGEMDSLEMVGYDPQTSGGLLLSMLPEAAERLVSLLAAEEYPLACAIIGEAIADDAPGRIFFA